MPAHREPTPLSATPSSYQRRRPSENVTSAKRSPARQADSIAASAMPTTGIAKRSRAALSPGSPNAAMTTASTSSARSAIIASAAAPASCASAREAM